MKKRKFLQVASVALMGLTVGASIASASYGQEHIMLGEITGGAGEIRVWNDASVVNYGYKGSVDNAIADWNAASTQLGLYYNSSSPEVKVYVSTSLPAGVAGATDYWNYGIFGDVSQVPASAVSNGTSDFDQARIRLGQNNMSGWTWEERFMNTGHEFGHTLSLDHFENSPAHTGSHWMKSGKFALPDPTTTDNDHLRNKWGN